MPILIGIYEFIKGETKPKVEPKPNVEANPKVAKSKVAQGN